MMRKINNWLDKPWTNRTYVKLSFWSIVMSFVISLLMIKKINRDFGATIEKPKKVKVKNTNSLFDEVRNKNFRL